MKGKKAPVLLISILVAWIFVYSFTAAGVAEGA